MNRDGFKRNHENTWSVHNAISLPPLRIGNLRRKKGGRDPVDMSNICLGQVNNMCNYFNEEESFHKIICLAQTSLRGIQSNEGTRMEHITGTIRKVDNNLIRIPSVEYFRKSKDLCMQFQIKLLSPQKNYRKHIINQMRRICMWKKVWNYPTVPTVHKNCKYISMALVTSHYLSLYESAIKNRVFLLFE